MSSSGRQPVFYISHGGPTLLENDGKPGDFYSWFGNYLKNELKPKAVVIISAHWQGKGRNGIYVDTSKKPEIIYDFYGFPNHFYKVTWDHQGSPEIASRVIELLNKNKFNAEGVNYGNDHGVWVPLKRAMNSNRDIPIVEVSTFEHEDMELHTKMGEALSPLRDEGVVIIGSGSAVHNLRLWRTYPEDHPSPQFVIDFDNEMERIACKLKGDERMKAANKLNAHRDFRNCHPTAEHLVPYHIALGAAGSDTGIKLLHGYYSSLSWGSYGFGMPSNFKSFGRDEL